MAQKIELCRHTNASDYGRDAYTVFPGLAICNGLSTQQAALFNAAQDMRKALKAAVKELGPNKLVSDRLLNQMTKALAKAEVVPTTAMTPD